MNGPASKVLVPKLRFPGFSGEWQAKELGSITKWSSGGTPAKDNPKYWGGDISWISAASMYGSTFSSSERTLTELGARSGTKIAKQGSLLLLVRGSMLFNTIPVGIAGRDVAFNQDVKAITSEALDHRYLLYFFQASEHKLLSKVVGTGIGAGKLDMEDMYGLTVAVPSLDEQQKIAEFLTAVDDRIGLSELKLELLKKYKQGVMQKIFTQQIRFRDDDGNDYPGWQATTVGEVVSLLKDGTHGTHIDLIGSKYMLLSAKNIQDGAVVVDSTDRTISEEEFSSIQKSYKLQPGDILLTIVGTIGNVAVWDSRLSNMAFQRSVAFLRFKEVVSEFAYQLLCSALFQKELARRTVISAQPGVYLGDISRIPITLPSRGEQQKIADFLTVLDDKIKLEESKLEQARNFKKSLLQQMFV